MKPLKDPYKIPSLSILDHVDYKTFSHSLLHLPLLHISPEMQSSEYPISKRTLSISISDALDGAGRRTNNRIFSLTLATLH